MICLRCGYCCKMLAVVIVDDPGKGLIKDNLIFYNGGVEENKRCKHLKGEKPGEYSCAVHDKPWYKKTPCYSHGQIETSVDCKCRIGEHLLKDKL